MVLHSRLSRPNSVNRFARWCARRNRLYAELGLDDPATSETALLSALVAHPVLLNRPIVVTEAGAKLCRPPELVLDLLPPSK